MCRGIKKNPKHLKFIAPERLWSALTVKKKSVIVSSCMNERIKALCVPITLVFYCGFIAALSIDAARDSMGSAGRKAVVVVGMCDRRDRS